MNQDINELEKELNDTIELMREKLDALEISIGEIEQKITESSEQIKNINSGD